MAKSVPGWRGERVVAERGGGPGFGGVGALGACQPALVEGVADEIHTVGGDGGVFLGFGRVSGTDTKAGEQQGGTDGGGAGVGGEVTGAIGGGESVELLEERERPHLGVGGRGMGIEEDGVGCGQSMGVAGVQERGEVAEMGGPLDAGLAVGEVGESLLEQERGGGRERTEAGEGFGVVEGELELGEGTIEAEELKGQWEGLGGVDDGGGIGGTAQADVPDDEGVMMLVIAMAVVGGGGGVLAKPAGKVESVDVEGFGFGAWADAGVTDFVVVQ